VSLTEAQAAQREQLLGESFRDSAVCWLTADGRIASWNSGAEHMNGHRAAEVIGEHFSRFYSAEDVQPGKPDRLLRIAAAQGRAEDEGWRIRKQQSRFWARLVITALHDDAGQLCGFVETTRDMTQPRQISDCLQRLREQHDDVEQAFFAIGLAATRAITLAGRARGGHSPSAEVRASLVDALTRVTELAATGAEQLRTAILAIDDAEVVGRGLVPALSKLVRDFGQQTGIEADLVLTSSEQGLEADVAETLYATAREALANVQHHSRAGAVVLGLRISPSDVTLCIQDDGSGASAPWDGGAHSGLPAIAERVRCLSGSFVAGPNPDGGFLVRAQLPLTLGSA
jgi:PAS domain S-box-containing protein